MKKRILYGLCVFVFTFLVMFLTLSSRNETYAIALVDNRFGVKMSICVQQAFIDKGLKKSEYWDSANNKFKKLNKITSFTCTNKELESVSGLDLLTNVTNVDLSHNKISTVDIKNSLIRTINLSYNNLISVKFATPSSLIKVYLNNNKLTSVNFKLNVNDKDSIVNLSNNRLESVNIEHNSLRKLILYNNLLTQKPDVCKNLNDRCNYGYQVNFYNGNIKIASRNVKAGSLVYRKPDNPTKDNNRFVGWYKNSELTQEFSLSNDKVNKDLTLRAKFEPSTHPDNGLILTYRCRKNSSLDCENLPDTYYSESDTSWDKVTISNVKPRVNNSNYKFLFWESKASKATTTAYSSNCSLISSETLHRYGKDKCKSTITITKKNTLYGVWEIEGMPEESETTSSSINSIYVISTFIFGLFIVFGGSVLIYSYVNSKKKLNKN